MGSHIREVGILIPAGFISYLNKEKKRDIKIFLMSLFFSDFIGEKTFGDLVFLLYL